MFRIHDLLRIDAQRFLGRQESAPAWVAGSLKLAPFVVVRRGAVSEEGIAVGVRGAQRNERWAGTCQPDMVAAVSTPPELLKLAAEESVPALRALSLLATRWKSLAHPWGPGGSVGFQLATRTPAVRLDSDLDVVIYCDTPLPVEQARDLRDSAQGLPTAVDIRVETPFCGFSLTEYASQSPAPILLRVPSGVVLGTDPWAQR